MLRKEQFILQGKGLLSIQSTVNHSEKEEYLQIIEQNLGTEWKCGTSILKHPLSKQSTIDVI